MGKINLHPELAPRLHVEQNLHTALPLQQHVNSLLHIIKNLESTAGINPQGAEYARIFALRHDAGYGTNIDILSSQRAQHIIGEALEAIDSPVSPRRVAEYIQDNRDDYTAARIIGHGALGLVENSIYFQDKLRLSRAKALGIASLLSAHHPGLPITMVSELTNKPIPHELRLPLFIDDNGTNAEEVRYKLARFGANQLNISHKDGFKAAAFGYALDRITAASPPQAIVLENNRPKVIGGEVIQKKYGLVAGDLRQEKERADPSLEVLYSNTVRRLRNELKAALHTVQLTGDKEMFEYFNTLGNRQLHTTYSNQNNVITQLNKYGFTGRFSRISEEYNALLQKAKETNDQHLLYALATYDHIK